MFCCAAPVEGTFEETTVQPLTVNTEKEPKDEEVKEVPALAPVPSAAPPAPFDVAIDTTEGSLGLTVDARLSTLMVAGVSAGLLKEYNEASEAAKQVQPGDFILDVDGKTEPEEMMKELAVKGSHQLKVQHPVTFKAVVKKNGQSAGLSLSYVATSPSITVKWVLMGAVQEYNQTAPADAQINAGDRIMAVGAVAGEAGKMVEAMKAADTIEFTIARVSP